MLGNNKKTIGVFVSQVNTEFQDALSKGIITKAKSLDYNVVFFTNFGGYGHHAYDIGELHITDLPNYEELDGIIMVPYSLIVKDLEYKYKMNMKNKAHCPVVSVLKEMKDCYNVLIEDNSVLDEIISHFIEIHGFSRINFLAGPKDFPDSEKRLASYKRILKEHNIPIEEDRIYYGDFWRHKGVEAVDFWLNSPLERPQAIICANDYMALTVCQTLLERGISIPDHIAVSGCDDVEDAAEYSPSLTTARMPVFDMGMEAVEKIHKDNMGIDQPINTYIKTSTIYRESCGCKKNWYYESNRRRQNHIIARENLQHEIARNADVSTELTGLTKLEEVVDKVWSYVYENANFTHFIMSLEKEWDNYQNDGKTINNDKEVIMEVGFKNRVGFSKIKFPRNKLIPTELVEDSAMVYFFAILHHQGHLFGYVGISFDKIQTYMLTFQAWVMNVSNALENVRVHGELNRLVYQLEDMSIRDDLTGLYNRRVINTLGKKYLKQCVEEHSKLMVLTADMDKLKYINDKYGHSSGDIALKVVADALKKTADDDEICIRMGGDEFMAIGIDYDETKMTNFVNRFMEELNCFNFINEYDFAVYISYGCNLILPDENTTIEGCLMAVDVLMYQQKQEKESKCLRENLVY